MFRELPRYTDTSSNSFWSSRIPSHWQVQPGLAVLQENKRKNSGLIEAQVLSLSYGKVVVKPAEKQRGLVPESYEGYQVLGPGDIVVRPTDLQNDQTSIRVGHVKNRGIITSAYIGLRPSRDWSDSYAFLYLTVIDSSKRIYGMGSGLRQQLGWWDLRRMPCLVPPAEEQAAIVKYLAHANERIDSAIRTKRRIIALLQEQRARTIDDLVTGRGESRQSLSSRPWMETVPEGWEWRRCRTISRFVTSGSRGWAEYYADGGPIFLQSGNLGRQLNLKLSNVQRVNLPHFASEGIRTRVRPRDLLVCITGALTGNVAMVPDGWTEEAYVNQHIALIRPVHDAVDSEFLGLAMKSRPSQTQFRGNEYGGTKQGLGLDEVKNLEVLIPSLTYQRAVVARIVDRTARLDQAIDSNGNEVSLLEEFRTRLVADVVTGQVDVRAVAAALPDAPEALESSTFGLDDDLEEALVGSEA